jgi:aspartyl-tRNA(Asn)/glutamyl-tRNA(Gln) amidotransferase subunit B
MDGVALTPATLAEMIALIEEGVISGKIAKDVLPKLLEGEGASGLRAYVESQGLVQISGRFLVMRWDTCVQPIQGLPG